MKSLRAEAAADPDLRARFLREGELAAHISHPNVVQVFDVIERPEGDAYLVMELLDGNDLGAELSARGPLPVEWLCDVMLPVCAAVAQVHARGLLHRDIKPGNLFLSRSPDGEVIPKLLDFGISRPLDQQTGELRTRTGTVLGSPRYMAPEQLEAKRDIDLRADVYALGAVLYRCLTGAMPYQHPGDTTQVELFTLISRIAGRELLPPRSWRPDLPAPLEAVTLRAMAYDRAQRFGDARVGAALVPFASPAARARWEPVLSRVSLGVPVSAPSVARPEATIDLEPSTNAPSVSKLRSPQEPAPRRSALPWIATALGIVLFATLAGLGVRASRATTTAPTPPDPPRHTLPPAALVATPAPVPPPAPTPAPPVAEAPAVAPPAAVTADDAPDDRRRRRRNRSVRVRAGTHGTAAPDRAVAATSPSPARPVPSAASTARCANGADCDL